MTPQGRAIKQAAIDFGNCQTLPFTPCKKGYIPIVDGERNMACPFHNKAREKRFAKDKSEFRPGEVDLNIFWRKYDDGDADEDADENVEEATERSSSCEESSGKLKKKVKTYK
jgi:hypothetical protein